MTIDEFNQYIRGIADDAMEDCTHIVAETATEYYQEAFRHKAFDGELWQPAKTAKSRGSLLVDTGKMVNSIRPSVVTPERVVISAGNDKVIYAQAHNEGVHGSVSVKAHTRKVKGKTIQVSPFNRIMNMPKRQFMGHAEELNKRIRDRIEGYFNALKQR